MAGERTLPGIGLTGFWDLGDNTWKPGMDNNLRLISVLTQGRVLSIADPIPATPADGDIYLMASTAATNPDHIAVRDDGAWVFVPPQEGFKFCVLDTGKEYMYDGTEWVEVVSGGGSTTAADVPYDIAIDFAGTPGAGETVDCVLVPRQIVFDADFAASLGYVGTNPTAPFTLDVQDDGSSIGTITVDTAGDVTFVTTGNAEITVAAGSKLTFVAITPADATVADGFFTLAGKVPGTPAVPVQVSAERWRIFNNTAPPAGFVWISELFLKTSIGGTQAAIDGTSGTASASSQSSGYTPAGAFNDNDTNTSTGNSWSTNSGQAANSWLEFDFDVATAVLEVTMATAAPGNYAPTDFELQYFDGANWVATDTFNITAGDYVTQAYTFPVSPVI